MYIERIYKNSSDEVLRIDKIVMLPTTSITAVGNEQRTFRRNLTTELVLEDSISRVVDVISLITNANDYDPPGSGPANYTWASWTAHGGVRCNMSDLPQVGDSV